MIQPSIFREINIPIKMTCLKNQPPCSCHNEEDCSIVPTPRLNLFCCEETPHGLNSFPFHKWNLSQNLFFEHKILLYTTEGFHCLIPKNLSSIYYNSEEKTKVLEFLLQSSNLERPSLNLYPQSVSIPLSIPSYQ